MSALVSSLLTASLYVRSTPSFAALLLTAISQHSVICSTSLVISVFTTQVHVHWIEVIVSWCCLRSRTSWRLVRALLKGVGMATTQRQQWSDSVSWRWFSSAASCTTVSNKSPFSPYLYPFLQYSLIFQPNSYMYIEWPVCTVLSHFTALSVSFVSRTIFFILQKNITGSI